MFNNSSRDFLFLNSLYHMIRKYHTTKISLKTINLQFAGGFCKTMEKGYIYNRKIGEIFEMAHQCRKLSSQGYVKTNTSLFYMFGMN